MTTLGALLTQIADAEAEWKRVHGSVPTPANLTLAIEAAEHLSAIAHSTHRLSYEKGMRDAITELLKALRSAAPTASPMEAPHVSWAIRMTEGGLARLRELHGLDGAEPSAAEEAAERDAWPWI